jgi:hypothetical protein
VCKPALHCCLDAERLGGIHSSHLDVTQTAVTQLKVQCSIFLLFCFGVWSSIQEPKEVFFLYRHIAQSVGRKFF